MRTLLPLALLLAACGPSRASFSQEAAVLTCEKISECLGQTGIQLAGYDDLEDCKASAPTDLADETDENTCPEFSSEQASLCLEQLRTADCDNFDDVSAACDEVCPS